MQRCLCHNLFVCWYAEMLMVEGNVCERRSKTWTGFCGNSGHCNSQCRIWRVRNIELVTPNFQDLLASVTSHVDQESTTKVTSSALSFIYQALYIVISCRRKLLVPQYHCVPSVHYKSSMTLTSCNYPLCYCCFDVY